MFQETGSALPAPPLLHYILSSSLKKTRSEGIKLGALPRMDREPTGHPQKICTGALLLEGPG